MRVGEINLKTCGGTKIYASSIRKSPRMWNNSVPFLWSGVDFLKKIYNNVQKGPGIVWKFDYSFLDNGLIPASIVNNTSKIHSPRTETSSRKKEVKAVFTELESIARVQS